MQRFPGRNGLQSCCILVPKGAELGALRCTVQTATQSHRWVARRSATWPRQMQLRASLVFLRDAASCIVSLQQIHAGLSDMMLERSRTVRSVVMTRQVCVTACCSSSVCRLHFPHSVMTRSMRGIRPPKHPFEYNGIEWPAMKIKGTGALPVEAVNLQLF